jgi:hypothetical protein
MDQFEVGVVADGVHADQRLGQLQGLGGDHGGIFGYPGLQRWASCKS